MGRRPKAALLYNDPRPVVGITMGDPAGVGPEIIAKALCDPEIRDTLRPIVYGDKGVMTRVVKQLDLPLKVQEITAVQGARILDDTIHVKSISNLKVGRLRYGKPDRNCGRAMVNYIKEAVRNALSGEIDAITTAPINKEMINEAGFRYSGHTELMAELTGSRGYAMMFAGEKIKVSLVTTHVAVRDIILRISPGKIYKVGLLTWKALRDYFGVESPRLAVCSLNPHSGEGGLFGDEEKEIIHPAVISLQSVGIDAVGPFPPDTVFYHALNGKYDAVISMYHDQALIPVKLVHFKDAVNITLGLNIVRTSVDHGTAYDIAGKGIADYTSMKHALIMAAKISKIKKEREEKEKEKEKEKKRRFDEDYKERVEQSKLDRMVG